MMCCHRIIAQSFGEVMRCTLGQASRIDKDQGGRVLVNLVFEPLVYFCPDFIRHDRFQR